MLRVYPDREVAKEAARVNVSALATAGARLITPEAGLSARQVTQAIARGGGDLRVLQGTLSLVMKKAPAMVIERLITAPGPDLDRER